MTRRSIAWSDWIVAAVCLCLLLCTEIDTLWLNLGAAFVTTGAAAFGV